MDYSKLLTNTRETPQSQKAKPNQVKNSAGGYTFNVGHWGQLERFLTLGSAVGTFYADARKHTYDNVQALTKCFDEDYARAVETIGVWADENRGTSPNHLIVALALAMRHPYSTARVTCPLVLRVCRTGTHILTLTKILDQTGGWGSVAARTVAHWYESKDFKELAYQGLKYKQRDGWSHRDALRLSHPSPKRMDADAARWLLGKPVDNTPHLVNVVEEANAESTDTKRLVALIAENKSLTWEMLPTAALKEAKVWTAFLERGMPLTAMIRNLNRMTSLGVLKPLSSLTAKVVETLTNAELLKKARIHPITMLKAQRVYGRGQGFRGNMSWTQVPEISSALEDGFYLAFGVIEPANKRTLMGIDVSGSMSTPCDGADMISCAEGAAVMAMATYRTEPRAYAHGFAQTFRDLKIKKTDSLDEVCRKTNEWNFGATDCALPMLYALEQRIEVDTFVVYTDNETWYGRVHPHQALEQYRNKMGINSKLAVVAMRSNAFSIADPSDPYQLDMVGFDAATPVALSKFSAQ